MEALTVNGWKKLLGAVCEAGRKSREVGSTKGEIIMLRRIEVVFTEEDDNGNITVESHLDTKNDTGSNWPTLVASAFQVAEKMASQLGDENVNK